MATTAAVGIDGGFTTISGYNGIFNEWTAQVTQPVTEVTAFGATSRAYRGGVFGMTFTASGNPKFDASSHAPFPYATSNPSAILPTKAAASVTLTVATGCTFGGSAIIGSSDLSSNIRSNDSSLVHSGTFSGDVTQTWDETP